MIDQRKIIFIVGNSHSGATMLGRILGNHSLIYTFGELHFFEQQVDAVTVNQSAKWSREKLISMLERLLTTSRDGFFCRVISGKYKQEAEKILVAVEGNGPVSAYETFLKVETKQHGKKFPANKHHVIFFRWLKSLLFFLKQE